MIWFILKLCYFFFRNFLKFKHKLSVNSDPKKQYQFNLTFFYFGKINKCLNCQGMEPKLTGLVVLERKLNCFVRLTPAIVLAKDYTGFRNQGGKCERRWLWVQWRKTGKKTQAVQDLK